MTTGYKYVKKSTYKRKAWLNTFKAGKPCSKCNVVYPTYVLDWHHRDKTTKLFGISSGQWRHSREKLLQEMEKCDLICANCHRIIEYMRRGGAESSFAS